MYFSASLTCDIVASSCGKTSSTQRPFAAAAAVAAAAAPCRCRCFVDDLCRFLFSCSPPSSSAIGGGGGGTGCPFSPWGTDGLFVSPRAFFAGGGGGGAASFFAAPSGEAADIIPAFVNAFLAAFASASARFCSGVLAGRPGLRFWASSGGADAGGGG